MSHLKWREDPLVSLLRCSCICMLQRQLVPRRAVDESTKTEDHRRYRYSIDTVLNNDGPRTSRASPGGPKVCGLPINSHYRLSCIQ